MAGGGGGLESIHGGGGCFQEKGKYLANDYTVACKLKNVFFS